MREDYPDYSQCNILVDILPGMTEDIYFYNDNTKLLLLEILVDHILYGYKRKTTLFMKVFAGPCNGRCSKLRVKKSKLENGKKQL